MEHNLLQTSLDNAAYKERQAYQDIWGHTKGQAWQKYGSYDYQIPQESLVGLGRVSRSSQETHIQSQGKTVTLQRDLNKMPSSRASPPPPRLLSWTLVILQRQARMPLISTQAGLREGFHLSQRTWEILSLQHIWEQTSFVENNQNIKHFFYKK